LQNLCVAKNRILRLWRLLDMDWRQRSAVVNFGSTLGHLNRLDDTIHFEEDRLRPCHRFRAVCGDPCGCYGIGYLFHRSGFAADGEVVVKKRLNFIFYFLCKSAKICGQLFKQRPNLNLAHFLTIFENSGGAGTNFINKN